MYHDVPIEMTPYIPYLLEEVIIIRYPTDIGGFTGVIHVYINGSAFLSPRTAPLFPIYYV